LNNDATVVSTLGTVVIFCFEIAISSNMAAPWVVADAKEADVDEVVAVINVAYKVESDPDSPVSFKTVDRFQNSKQVAAAVAQGHVLLTRDSSGKIAGCCEWSCFSEEVQAVREGEVASVQRIGHFGPLAVV
jgi:hypothetical protein